MGIIELKPYSNIQGKWNQNTYEVVKKLGQGGIGVVYLVRELNTENFFALKISKDNTSINREYELIKKFQNVEMVINAYEIDDLEVGNQIFYYIRLEYVSGMNLHEYFKNKIISTELILGLMLIVVNELSKIHSYGYILGDLKLENIMVNSETKQLKLIDFGAVVHEGEAINEFTPSYDKASWQCGDRIAKESYDIFVITMIIIRLILKEEFNPRTHTIDDIIKRINESHISKDFKKFLMEGLVKEQKLNCFAKDLKKIYNREKLSRRHIELRRKDQKTNMLFILSVYILISTTVYILIKLY